MEAVIELVRSEMKAAGLKVPHRNEKVFKDECMFSFNTPESEGGIYINLKTFQGFGAKFVDLDCERTGNSLYLHETWTKIPLTKEELEALEAASAAAPAKMALGGEGSFSLGGPLPKHRIEKKSSLVVLPGRQTLALPCPDLPELVLQVIEGIHKHDSASAKEEASVWEEEKRVSRYAADLIQLDNGRKISPDPKQWKCDETGVTENLWLNLSTGFIGSGRQNWDGTGGNGSALRHYSSTGSKYPLVVKLGTITPHGADVYSYAADEDEMVIDPLLSQHLAHWGINMMQMEKTDKTMAELQIQMNLSYEFGRITESGTLLIPLFGPGHVGLINLGSSCYMNSVLQVVLTLPEVKARYADLAEKIFQTSPSDPSQDLAVQMAKVAVALNLGLTCKTLPPVPPAATNPMEVDEGKEALDDKITANAVRPASFKSLVGKGHPEFSSARQQDVQEYFDHLVELISRSEFTFADRLSLSSLPATKSLFALSAEDRIQCLESHRVSYKQRTENMLQFYIPLDAATNKEEVESYKEREAKRARMKEGEAEAYIGQQGAPVDLTKEDPVVPKVPFAACLERMFGDEVIDDLFSAALGRNTSALKRMRLASLPPYLVLTLKRYYVGENWTPKKLEVSIEMPSRLDLSGFRAKGPQPNEELQPAAPVVALAAPAPAAIDEGMVAQLMSMGFSENGCKRACLAVSSSLGPGGAVNVDSAMEWIFAHMEDPDFNEPPPQPAAAPAPGPPGTAGSGTADGGVDPEGLLMLESMGFDTKSSTAALKSCGGNIERAADWLFSHMDDLSAAVEAVLSKEQPPAAPAPPSGAQETQTQLLDSQSGSYELLGFISHMGSSTSCGHYVCHIKKEGKWVIFNDEKVAVSEKPPLDLGFMYFYRRLD